ncbi:MAG: hypothetical protein FOGNACKC_06262 [Anaerolineae bacterium]|nr:hypothetical protein [Anaerolineae bacterium]
MCNWICDNLLDEYRRKHPRWFRVELWEETQLDKTLPRICSVSGVVGPVLRPAEFGECYINPGDQDYLVRHLVKDIEDALAGRCDHQSPDLLIVLTLVDGDSVLFYPCEAVNLLGENKAQKILMDLLAEARQSLQPTRKTS